MRKLATIETISDLRPHPNADSLELATVRGWQICVKKGEFKPGGLCVYCEIDSVLPERPEFEFLRDRKFRIKTIKLRGELSQGICFPMDILHGYVDDAVILWPGDDVTQQLGVTLYSPPLPACLGGDVVGSFPSFIPKTDCERIQNHEWLLHSDLSHVEWSATEKLDGSSATFFWKDDALHVCSRNWELKYSERNAFWQAALRANLEAVLRHSFEHLALQGELLGPGIQGNRYKLGQPSLFFFDAFDWRERRYLDVLDFFNFCDLMDLDTVPLMATRTNLRRRTLPKLLVEAEGKSALFGGAEREGLVWKPMVEERDPRIGRAMFKTISNAFLLRQKD
jgi:RNA ligase (TIGR02306 family)